MKFLPSINPEQETEKIVDFLKSIQNKTKKNKVVIGLSGGIDSTVTHYLLKKVYRSENIIGVRLPNEAIKLIVDQFMKKNYINPSDKVRIGNIMARTRMTILFDLAKKNNALVCGTENKSERLLGYFTRFGDAASDIEPISHLYKTQIYQLAKYLKVPKEVINAKPTAGLWSGQTDEGEFGFTYKEADQILYLYENKKMKIEEIEKLGFKNTEKIIKRVKDNQFKQEVPYKVII